MAVYPFFVRNRLLFQLIIVLVSVIITLLTDNLAIAGLTVLLFTLGTFLINRLNDNSKDAISLFSFIFLIYYLYTFITDYIYVSNFNTDFFYALDSTKFFGMAYDLNAAKADLDSYLFDYRFSFGYGYLVYFLNLFTNLLDGYPTTFLHKIHIVFLSSSVIAYTYILAKKLIHNIDKRVLFGYVLVYGLLSHFLVFSAILIRDIHIVFLYLLAFIILTRKNNIINFLILILICILAFQFRLANGAFALIFLIAFFYKSILKIKSKTQRRILTFVIILIGLVIAFSISGMLDISELENKAEGYSDYHDQMLKEGSGFAKILYKLPVVVRPFIFVFLSQISSLPATQAIYINTIGQNQFLLFPLVLSIVFWIYIDLIIILNFYKRKFFKKLDPLLGLFVLISATFLIATASSSPEFRRLLPVYPIFYIYFIFIYHNLSSFYKKNSLTVFLIFYMLISCLVYLM